MDAVRSTVMGLVGKKDTVTNLFLLGVFVALGVRSSNQQQQIEELEAEKSSLQSGNKAMAASMWGWRQNLFQLAESDPSAAPIALSRLRTIYGEDEPPAATHQDSGEDAEHESVQIS